MLTKICMYIKRLAFIIMIFWQYCSMGRVRYVSVPGIKVRNEFVNESLTLSSSLECVSVCRQRQGCRTMSYNKEEQQCMLSDKFFNYEFMLAPTFRETPKWTSAVQMIYGGMSMLIFCCLKKWTNIHCFVSL